MSRTHFMIIFAIIAFSLIFVVFGQGYSVRKDRKEIEELEETVDFATWSAICTLADSYGETGSLEEVSAEFFRAYQIHTQTNAEDLWMYVPAFIYLDTDGFRVGGYNDTRGVYEWSDYNVYTITKGDLRFSFTLNDNITVSSPLGIVTISAKEYFADWSTIDEVSAEKCTLAKSYIDAAGYTLFTAENYESLKTSAMATSISLQVTDLVNYHNKIVREKGMTYIYTTPTFVDFNTELPSFIVCFQGYPLRASGKYYSNLVERAAYLERAW